MSNVAVPIIDAPVPHEPDATSSGLEYEAQQAVPWVLDAQSGGTLKQRTIRSSLFTIVGYGASQGIRFVRSPLLAHMLFPDAFGLMAIVAMFLGMFQQFSDVGLAPAIIRSERG